MEGGCRRAVLYLFVLTILYVSNIACQNVLLEGESRGNAQNQIIDLNREVPSKAQLMNTLLSLASGKNGYPETTPTPQINKYNVGMQDKQYANINPNQRQNAFNVVSVSPQTNTLIPKESFSISPMLTTTSLPQPAIATNSVGNVVLPASYSSAYSPYIRPYQPTVIPTQTPCSIPRPPQVIPLENYANMVQSYPTIWQPQTQSEMCSYNSYPSVVYTEPLNPLNMEISSSSVLPAINSETGIYDILSGPCKLDIPVPESVVMVNERDGLPFNVQINVPPQNTPAPRITLVTAPAPIAPSKPDSFPPYYPPPMPVMMRNTRSSWKNILPIILVALLSNQDGYGGCCCPCNCGCNSDSPTPIPYPIPIPVNNAIINNVRSSPNRSRKPGNNQNEDYNDEN